jgi:signal transduction histidine kinase
MLRNMKVGTKLFAVLAAPVVVLVVLATVGVNQRLAEADDASRTEQLTEFVQINSDVVQALQVEAVWSAGFMGSGGSEFRAELDAARATTDAALGAFREALQSVDPGRDSKAVQDALRNADSRLNNLRTNRNSVDLDQTSPADAVESYANTYDDLVTVNAAIVQLANDPDLLRGLNTVVNLERVKNAVATEGGLLTAVAAEGAFTATTGAPCADVEADCASFNSLVTAGNDVAQTEKGFSEGGASPEEKQLKRDREAGQAYEDLKQRVIEDGRDGNQIAVDATAVVDATLERLGGLKEVENVFIGNVVTTAADLKADAQTAARLYVLGAATAIVVALVVAFLVSRATTVPLRKLTNAAYTLSTERLPALVERLRNPEEGEEPLSATLRPIDIHSKDEIGQLAEAFNSIQQVTVEVAEEQAQLLRKGIGDIFINLARRNQTLLDRQIEFIDQLEANEEDPDQLDNLFKLDHLATRMRRNAESLLVLAGAEPPRRRGRPVSLADVVRVAIGEVEDFARIQLLALDEASVGGNVAVDLAHLLSELMENATHFSPPDTMVEIVGHRSGEGYILSVSDQGIGMSADQLAEANAQLAHPPLVGLALSRSLGFIVIGRLAQRFGISVKLTSSPSGGVTALVTLPPELVTYPDEGAAPEEAAGGTAPAGLQLDTPPAEAAVDTVAGETATEEEVTEEVREPVPAATPSGPSEDLLDELVEEVVPEDEEFERGLQSLVSEGLGSGPVEPPAPEPAPTSVAVQEPPAPTPPPAAEPPAAPAEAPQLTAAGLVRRTPKKRAASADQTRPSTLAGARTTTQTSRSPEEVRRMLSRYRSGLNRGRSGADPDTTKD